jgi:biopolymer transport protein ExbB
MKKGTNGMDIDGVLRNLVGLGATWVLWLLLGLSVLALAVMFERAAFFCRTRERRDALRRELMRGISGGRLDDARRYLEGSSSLEAHIVRAGVDARCPEQAQELMASEAHLQRVRAEKNLAFLGTLGNNAPFVGLFGTVIGIIGAFAELDASGGRLTTALMAEIGEALTATAVGILVALPAVAAYNAFQRAIQVRLGAGDALGRLVVAHLHVADHGTKRLGLAEPARASGAE